MNSHDAKAFSQNISRRPFVDNNLFYLQTFQEVTLLPKKYIYVTLESKTHDYKTDT
jgi:hypothetical protein